MGGRGKKIKGKKQKRTIVCGRMMLMWQELRRRLPQFSTSKTPKRNPLEENLWPRGILSHDILRWQPCHLRAPGSHPDTGVRSVPESPGCWRSWPGCFWQPRAAVWYPPNSAQQVFSVSWKKIKRKQSFLHCIYIYWYLQHIIICARHEGHEYTQKTSK